jgi:geranylgeranyl pyrophosphate synthase
MHNDLLVYEATSTSGQHRGASLVLIPFKGLSGLLMQVIVETGKAVGAEGLVAGQVVDIKSEGQAEKASSNQIHMQSSRTGLNHMRMPVMHG